MSFNKVEISNVDTSTLKTLTEDEKRELLRRTRDGDKQARLYTPLWGNVVKPRVLENDWVSFSLEVTEPAGETGGPFMVGEV